MAHLPTCSGQDAIRAFGRIGYVVDHQTGSHLILRNVGEPHRRLTVPNHRELKRGLLRKLIREAGLTVEQFREFLNS
jgi:predicted RNA binding protein YcfA (HicA-like mRNA interferase family)